MRKHIRIKVLLLTITIILGLSLSGCGGIDAALFLRSGLDSMRTGVLVPEYVEICLDSEEEIKQDLENLYSRTAEYIIQGIDSNYVSEDMKETALDCARAVYKTLKYEVAEDHEVKDGVYYVEVMAYPGKTLANFNSQEAVDAWLEKGKWADKASSYSSENKFYHDLYAAFLLDMTKYLSDESNWDYGEPSYIQVRVEKNEEEQYQVNEEDYDKLITTLCGE